MTIPKKFFHDRIVLLLLSTNVFLALLTIVLVLLRLGGTHGEGYIVQYRANLGLNAYQNGSISTVLSFMLFSVAVTLLHWVLSMRIYHIRRQLAVTVLGFGTLLLLLSLVVSNALLGLAR